MSRDSSEGLSAGHRAPGVVPASDPEGTLCQDYAVWLQMSMYGRK